MKLCAFKALLVGGLSLSELASARNSSSSSCSKVAYTVQTSNGKIVGHLAPNVSNVVEYLGIPYAKPPIGELRFAAPQALGETKGKEKNKTFEAAKFVSFVFRLIAFAYSMDFFVWGLKGLTEFIFFPGHVVTVSRYNSSGR